MTQCLLYTCTQVSPLPISVQRWTGVRGLGPGRGKVARVLHGPVFSPHSVLCNLSLSSASLDSAAHSPAGPGRLLTWLVLGPGHLESAIQRIMSGDAGCEAGYRDKLCTELTLPSHLRQLIFSTKVPAFACPIKFQCIHCTVCMFLIYTELSIT